MDSSGTEDCILDKAVERFYVYITTWGTWVDGGVYTSLVFNEGLALTYIVLRSIIKEPAFTCK